MLATIGAWLERRERAAFIGLLEQSTRQARYSAPGPRWAAAGMVSDSEAIRRQAEAMTNSHGSAERFGVRGEGVIWGGLFGGH